MNESSGMGSGKPQPYFRLGIERIEDLEKTMEASPLQLRQQQQELLDPGLNCSSTLQCYMSTVCPLGIRQSCAGLTSFVLPRHNTSLEGPTCLADFHTTFVTPCSGPLDTSHRYRTRGCLPHSNSLRQVQLQLADDGYAVQEGSR